ncbi:hypothetical protein [Modestobacter sp. KNN46-3]|jgi:hypothetical protein|uniref:hypothetical protein n=1 Tax=Modestobacter sp. KNN46-3 TaxID=2711218 RepID=UPI0013E048B1|nr:hypothetical protein [Modestobacter sp. KNN46-3]
MDGDTDATDDVRSLRAALRTELVTAMRSRRADAVAALRSALAAIDNAEAVVAPGTATGATNAHLAGTRTGVGSTEADRRAMSIGDVRALMRAGIAERRTEADRYDTLGQHEAAGRLRREAEVLDHLADG